MWQTKKMRSTSKWGGFLAVLVLAGSIDAREAAVKRVLVMDLQHGGEVTQDQAHTLTELVTAHLSRVNSFYVISGSEIAQVANLESEKQQAGCTENVCLSELADALGARFIVFGRASTLGELYVVQLRLFDASEAVFLSRATLKTHTLDDLEQQLRAPLDKLISPLLDPSERRALVDRRSDTVAAGDASMLGEDAADDEMPALLVAGGGVLAAGLLAVAGTSLGGLYYDGIVNNPSTPGSEKSAARSTGSAVVLGGGIASVALVGAGALLLALGLIGG